MNASLLGLWWKHSDAGAVIILFIFATFSPHEPQPSWQIYVPTDGIYMGSLEMCCFMAWIMHLHKQPEEVPLYFSLLLPLSFYFKISLDFCYPDSYTYYDLTINYFFWLKTAFSASNCSHFQNIFRITSFYDHFLKQVFQKKKKPSLLLFFLHLSMSVTKLNGYSTAAVTSLIRHTKQQWPWLNLSLCQCNELWKESMHCQRNFCCTNQTPSGQNNARRVINQGPLSPLHYIT